MYAALFIACDMCAKVLSGKQGTAQMDKTHIIVKGTLGLYLPEEKDKHDNNGRVIWAKRKDDLSELHFCNEECLIGFLQAKKVLVDQSRQFNNNPGDEQWGKF